jgi:hypothetical protein
MGTCLARRAFLNGLGFRSSPIAEHEWPGHVDRFVFAAGIGRGIDLGSARSWRKWIWLPISYMGKLLGLGHTRRQLLRGSHFISQMRIDWIRYNQTAANRPYVVHLLGTKDEISRPEDVIDVDQFDNVKAVDVVARHEDIIVPNQNTEFHLASAFGAFRNQPRLPKAGSDTVIFLLHGIRDSKECFQELAAHINQRVAQGTKRVRVILPDYGRFSLIDFMSHRKIERVIPWFSDQYTQELALNPNATFHFGGHSNGTRVFGMSLSAVPRMSFEHIYLAASALPRDFDWMTLKSRKQVSKMRADRGLEDWPVGVVAKVLNRFGFKSVGEAGAEGFLYSDIKENVFAGGHGAMLAPANMQSVGDFLLLGSSAAVPPLPFKLSWAFHVFRTYGDMIARLLLIVLALAFIALIGLPVFVSGYVGWAGPVATGIVVVLIYGILKRF